MHVDLLKLQLFDPLHLGHHKFQAATNVEMGPGISVRRVSRVGLI